jgi:hypothetical protein
MKPIAGRCSWEKNSRAGRSFWLPPCAGHRCGAFRKGRVKQTGLQRPNLFLPTFLLYGGIESSLNPILALEIIGAQPVSLRNF